MSIDPRIAKQRTALVLSQPFFGALVLRLKVVEDRSCETFWVDGESLGYNPDYLASLNDLEVRGVLAHEVLHVANGHCWRMGAREPERWNDAADYAINPIVIDAGMVLPKGAYLDARFTAKSAEEIYGILAQETRQKQKQQQQIETLRKQQDVERQRVEQQQIQQQQKLQEQRANELKVQQTQQRQQQQLEQLEKKHDVQQQHLEQKQVQERQKVSPPPKNEKPPKQEEKAPKQDKKP